MGNWIEILGYAASVLVAVSLMMKSLARLRFLNLIGASAFALYGLLAGAYPVMAVNGFIVIVNIVFLAKMQPGRSEAFDLLAIDRPDSPYLRRFLDFHAGDIRRFFPDFDLDAIAQPQIAFILRDMLPVGVVICEATDADTLRVRLDYVIPSHRDFRCAQYFYRAWSEVMTCTGICRFVARGGVDKHRSYLKRIGFAPDPQLGADWFARPA